MSEQEEIAWGEGMDPDSVGGNFADAVRAGEVEPLKLGPSKEEIIALLDRANDIMIAGKQCHFDETVAWKRDFVRLIG